MTKILVVGLAVVDFLFDVAEMPTQAQKYVARNASVVGGGGAANAAVAIARLGCSVKLAARVGDDFIADLIINDLQAASVDCSLIQRTPSAGSSFSSVLVDDNGERQIVNFRGRELSDNADMLKNLKMDAVLADTRWSTGTIAALHQARILAVPGVLDGEAPVSAEMLDAASHVAFSRQGLEDFTGGSHSDLASLQSALLSVDSQYPAWMCVTDGENGVFHVHENEIRHEPVRSVEVVDTLGAGDVWHGAFTYSLAVGNSELAAIRFANAAATLKCMKEGGGRQSPALEEIQKFIGES